MASFPLPYPELVLAPQSRNPSGSILHCDAWIRRGRNPPGRRAAFSYAARAKLSSAPIGVSRLFNEDSGDLGSLPALQHSTSKPFHPHNGRSHRYNVTGTAVFRKRNAVHESQNRGGYRHRTVFYFAYGSNMSSTVMADRCPNALSLGAARLDDHRLAFSLPSLRWGGYAADIETAEGSAVWGVLWEVATTDFATLDRVEARYDRYPVNVVRNGFEVTATTYRVKAPLASPNGGPPDTRYLASILAGATEHGLPHEYIRALGSTHRKITEDGAT